MSGIETFFPVHSNPLEKEKTVRYLKKGEEAKQKKAKEGIKTASSDAPLFPDLPHLEKLPETPSKVNFDRSSLFTPPEENDPVAKLPNTGMGQLIKLVSTLCDLQILSQTGQLKTFEAHQDGIKELRKKELTLLKENISTTEAFEVWAHRRQFLNHFGTALTVLGTAAFAGFRGGSKAALLSLAGGGATLATKLYTYLFGESTTASIMGLAGSILGGAATTWWGGQTVGKDQTETVVTSALSLALGFGDYYMRGKSTEQQQQKLELRAKNSELKFKKEMAEKLLKKLIGGFKTKEAADLIKATSKVVANDNEIKRRIVAGKQG
ncbi:hypothetical protein [Candidatus Neptunochlamydia vexilliferae]|uniref:Uncharacterized protein n=1 Tax=Candidatus Neptunichlamydia vexilliferae TaxID=1651774 RepID=A0ABS0B0Z3_9BACT|nr:hypothetical protein [Candidatus Neptunochlamydia vexilliferae]MBF5060062.1 hypothetical protein [Candidatus Neptunochlamydia vexilliferae]